MLLLFMLDESVIDLSEKLVDPPLKLEDPPPLVNPGENVTKKEINKKRFDNCINS
ncbi:hypothetical protein MtrunA17_Chr1g0149751 [Medicago truncatula]|uniref:Uncharacterized protein n=1 Tax=Medicago truncatula TaxID=3880 RepID=A0A396JL11_MEDTR|nr:hypothetical protein MtrunA17_Chr1g0149751 [Medicago truncatula]